MIYYTERKDIFMENIIPYLILATAVIALLFSGYKFAAVKKLPEGTEEMASISAKIRKGAMAYLKRQYKTVGIFFALIDIKF